MEQVHFFCKRYDFLIISSKSTYQRMIMNQLKSRVRNVAENDLLVIGDSDTLTLTPNNRTAVNLLQRAVSFELNKTGRSACRTPNVQSLSNWIESSFNSLRSKNVTPFCKLAIIGEQEVLSYWTEESYREQQSRNFVNNADWMSEVLKADKTLSRWCITEYSADTAVSEKFKQWRKNVHRKIANKGYVTKATALEMLIEATKKGTLELPTTVALYAFDEQPPLYKNLFKAIAKVVQLVEVDPHRTNNEWVKVAAANEEKQIDYAAKWASRIIETEPTATVAIVCPNLHNKRIEIIEKLQDIFEPQWILPENKSYTPPFDVSMGEPITNMPIIKRALFYLGIVNNQVESGQINSVIQDVFICADKEERLRRRQFALSMRDNRNYKTSLVKLAMRAGCPQDLKNKLSKYCRTMTNHPGKLTPANWAQLFHEALKALGWSLDLSVNEIEKRTLQKWGDCLDTLCGLDLHLGEISKNLAFSILANLCSATYVNAVNPGSPISVLGSLEAAGIDFDYIWVLDCNENVFPPPAKLNPCLPISLQVDNDMPHCSGDKEYRFTQTLFSRYQRSCGQLITSYSVQDNYGPLKPAAILKDIVAVGDIELYLDQTIIDYQKIEYKRYKVT